MHDVMIHPTAIVTGARIGTGTRVWAFAHVLPGASVGTNCNVADHVFIEGGGVVGDNVTLKNNVCVWDGITIDDDVFVGPNATFTNDRFPRSPRMPQMRERYARPENWLSPTHVGRGCTIGASATILPGLCLGEYCFIAAGAIVTFDVPAFALVAGSPARVVGEVCRCGRRLRGSCAEAVCTFCGETPEQRLQGLDADRTPRERPVLMNGHTPAGRDRMTGTAHDLDGAQSYGWGIVSRNGGNG